MLFATDDARHQFGHLHPDTRQVVRELDELLVSMKQPEAFITCVDRTTSDQRTLYTKIGLNLLERYATGKPISDQEARDVLALKLLLREKQGHGTARDIVGAWAEKKPSWHLRKTALDVRNSIYPTEVRESVEKWIRNRCPKPEWEVITENHGSGPHWHIARRDFSWLEALQLLS